ncbi:unnamed protein product [Lactuca virosa]|uniref:Uncharacterized protein n=1 Tax=Lactuca virosa TaxID=75947 RepID=A0AAU9MJI0_9ASTR|nr:unnamed protein product [Lactuca virosa]
MNSNPSLLESLPKVMSNVHDFFVYVASKAESIHQYMESMKTAYLSDQRGRGDTNDPFLEADRRETAKRAAAARRVHPTLHLPSNSQPSGTLLASSATTATATSSAAAVTPPVGAAANVASGQGCLVLRLVPRHRLLCFQLLLLLPRHQICLDRVVGPLKHRFLGRFRLRHLRWGPQRQVADPCFLPPFASNPASGASTFSTPFGTGAATGSGASFNTQSKARGKSRTGRR